MSTYINIITVSPVIELTLDSPALKSIFTVFTTYTSLTMKPERNIARINQTKLPSDHTNTWSVNEGKKTTASCYRLFCLIYF